MLTSFVGCSFKRSHFDDGVDEKKRTDAYGLDLVGSLALMSKDLRLGGCLNASIGGFGKIFFWVGSCTMVFQCVLTIVDTLLRQGWYLIARITLSAN